MPACFEFRRKPALSSRVEDLANRVDLQAEAISTLARTSWLTTDVRRSLDQLGRCDEAQSPERGYERKAVELSDLFPAPHLSKSDFLARFPAFRQHGADLDELRKVEYPLLQSGAIVYLDYTGAGLPADGQVGKHLRLLQSTFMTNPHSLAGQDCGTGKLLTQARQEVLQHFCTSSKEYQVIFTSNASGGLRLVGESFPFKRGSKLLLCADNHNSVNGIEKLSSKKGARLMRAPMTSSCQLDEPALQKLLAKSKSGPSLFAYPAQSNLTGVQHSLDWIEVAHQAGWDVLLDIAAYCPTNILDLSKYKPVFCCVSFYKLFGYPTGIGALLVRNSALQRLSDRPWYAGGTVSMVMPDGTPQMMGADGPARWEDGTVAFSAITAVPIGLQHLQSVGVANIKARISCLTAWTLEKMQQLGHPNGAPLIRIHGPSDMRCRGGTIAFNVKDDEGRFLSVADVNRAADNESLYLRTGCVCNPHGSWGLLETCTVQELRGWEPKLCPGRPGDDTLSQAELVKVVEGCAHSAGIVRISFGIASTFEDAAAAITFLHSFAAGTAELGLKGHVPSSPSACPPLGTYIPT